MDTIIAVCVVVIFAAVFAFFVRRLRLIDKIRDEGEL